MWMKLAGSVCVIVAGAYIGFALARQCQNRPRYIRQILSCIAALRSYLSYTTSPLADGLLECAKGTDGIVKDFFMKMAAYIESDYTVTPEQAAKEALAAYQERMALRREDREVMILFGSRLGTMDRKEQQKHLLMIEKRLDFLARQAAEESERSGKMYRYLGVCSGLFLVLLLV